MNKEQFLKNLTVPSGRVDVVLDTDTYNEIDDQFALSYLLAHKEKLNLRGICAAPFFNENSSSPKDGMEKSYNEILNLLALAGKKSLNNMVYKGSETYLCSETDPVESAAAEFLATLANEYSAENPLYIVAIGAVTNVASAILKNPKMADHCVVIWLGGHALHIPYGCTEFNMVQDIAAARVVYSCGIPLVQLPCAGVVDHFIATKSELEHWLDGKNPLCHYLCKHTVEAAESYAKGKPWSRVLWDVTAVAWLLNDGERFMQDRLITPILPGYDKKYSVPLVEQEMKYVWSINRDELLYDLFHSLETLGNEHEGL